MRKPYERERFIEFVRSRRPAVAARLALMTAWESAGFVRVEAATGMDYSYLQDKTHRQYVEELLSEFHRQPMRLLVERSSDQSAILGTKTRLPPLIELELLRLLFVLGPDAERYFDQRVIEAFSHPCTRRCVEYALVRIRARAPLVALEVVDSIRDMPEADDVMLAGILRAIQRPSMDKSEPCEVESCVSTLFRRKHDRISRALRERAASEQDVNIQIELANEVKRLSEARLVEEEPK